MTDVRIQKRPVVRPPARSRPTWPLLFFIFCAVVSIGIGAYFRWAIYDTMQTEADAGYFFHVTSSFFTLWADPGSENMGPIYVWATLYLALEQVGIQPDPLWGILINSGLVVAALHLFYRYAWRFYALTANQAKWLALLMGSNGVMMMSAGIHMRDAFLIFLTTVAVTLYGRPFNQWPIRFPGSRVAVLAGLSFLSYICRVESAVVPVMVAMVAIYAFGMRRLDVRIRIIVLVLGGSALLFVFTLLIDFNTLYTDFVSRNYDSYRELSESETDTGSAALYLLYQLPGYISVVVGSLQMLFIKIPAWANIWRGSYDFYMALAAIQMLVVAPLAISTMLASIYRRYSDQVMFHVLATVALLAMVSLTSIQVRHFAVLYPSLMLLVVLWRRETKGKREIWSLATAIGLGSLVGSINLYFWLASLF